MQTRARPKPFSQAIMDVVVPASFITPKIIFTGTEDPEAHLTTFIVRQKCIYCASESDNKEMYSLFSLKFKAFCEWQPHWWSWG